jgi:flavorubredoxin
VERTENKNDSNGRSFSIIAVITMLVGFATIWNVMNAQINSLKSTIDAIGVKAEAHSFVDSHPGTSERLGRLEERLSATEASICHTQDVANVRHQEIQIDTQMLWKKVFGIDYPSREYWPFKGGSK